MNLKNESGEILWSPPTSRREQSQMAQFMMALNKKHQLNLSSYQDLHAFSLARSEDFWAETADWVGIKWNVLPAATLADRVPGKMLGIKWFPGGKLNFAENLLFPSNTLSGSEACLVSIVEGIADPISLSRDELSLAVSRCQAFLRDRGVQKGDRVAAVVSNTYHAVVAMLASASLGAVWSSCSPDFGVQAIVDRFSQIQPKVIFTTATYVYNSKTCNTDATIVSVLEAIPSIHTCVRINQFSSNTAADLSDSSTVQIFPWEDIAKFQCEKITLQSYKDYISFEALEFSDPLYILYSSGTTGIPKCIVHSVGGTLLQHKKELMLHCDLKAGERILYYTTCGWMMWNWMVSALAVPSGIVLFEGALVSPDISVLWKNLARHEINILGTSPKFIAQNIVQEFSPKHQGINLSSLKTILSTGAPLLPEHFDWVYGEVKADVHLASISGGTDIISCFLLGNPLSPVRRGELQGAGLGMAVEVWGEEGQELGTNEKGDLVCVNPFVSMPTGFWGDAQNEKYFSAYFSQYKNREVWCHGDYIKKCPSGGFVILGRSDAVLNPGGVRIGTAEIYRVVENYPGIEDSLVVGIPQDGDVSVVLFVKMNTSKVLDAEFEKRLRTEIRHRLSPRHLPKYIFSISKIPYTRSGKKMELAVQKTLRGETLENESAMQDASTLDPYRTIYTDYFKNPR